MLLFNRSIGELVVFRSAGDPGWSSERVGFPNMLLVLRTNPAPGGTSDLSAHLLRPHGIDGSSERMGLELGWVLIVRVKSDLTPQVLTMSGGSGPTSGSRSIGILTPDSVTVCVALTLMYPKV